jgi:hypothetical protein
VRCWRFGAAARREKGEYPLWIFDRRATPLQWQRSATLRAKLWRAAGHVAPQSQSALAMLLRRALPAARQSLAHSFPIYEMGSSTKRDCLTDPSPGPPESARQISSTCSSKLLEAISSSFRKPATNWAYPDVNFFESPEGVWFRLCLTHCAALIS